MSKYIRTIIHNSDIVILISYITLFLVITLNDVLIFYTNTFFIEINRAIIVLIIMTIIILKKGFIDVKEFIYLNYFIYSVILTMILNMDFRGGYGFFLMSIGVAFAVSVIIPKDKFNIYMSNILIILAFLSLIVYIFSPFYKNISALPRFSTENLTYINLYISVIPNLTGYARLFGIFREPGVYGIFLNIGMMFTVIRNDISIIKKGIYMLVLLLATFFTFSTPAYIGAFLFLLIYLSQKNIKDKTQKKINSIMGILIIGFILILIFNPEYNKLFTDTFTNKTLSFDGRLQSIYVQLSSCLNRPIFGMGITDGYEYVQGMLISEYGNAHVTNTWLTYIMLYGFLIGITMLIGYWKFINSIFDKRYEKVLAFIATLLLMSSQAMNSNTIIFLLAFKGLTLSSDSNTKQRRKIHNESY